MANLIIVHYYDYTKVAEYGLAFRIFSIPGMILNMAFSGLWSAYAAAKINGEWKWIERIHKKALVNSSCISVVLSLILFLNLDWIAGVLSNGAISISTAMAIGMLIWGCLAGVGGSVASLLNGLNELNDQVLISFISCLVGFSLSLIISREYTYAGPIWGTSLAAMAAYPFLIRAANNVIYQKVRFH
jgi:O-antigen/teichoic acid export membrane protein